MSCGVNIRAEFMISNANAEYAAYGAFCDVLTSFMVSMAAAWQWCARHLVSAGLSAML